MVTKIDKLVVDSETAHYVSIDVLGKINEIIDVCNVLAEQQALPAVVKDGLSTDVSSKAHSVTAALPPEMTSQGEGIAGAGEVVATVASDLVAADTATGVGVATRAVEDVPDRMSFMEKSH